MTPVKSFTVAFAEHHTIIAQAVNEIIKSAGGQVLLETKSGKELIQQLQEAEVPGFCLLSMIQGENVSLTAGKLKQLFPQMKLLIYSVDSIYVNPAILRNSVADHFIAQLEQPEVLTDAILEMVNNS